VFEKFGQKEEDSLLYVDGKVYGLEAVKKLVSEGKFKDIIPKSNRKENINSKIESII